MKKNLVLSSCEHFIHPVASEHQVLILMRLVKHQQRNDIHPLFLLIAKHEYL